MQGLPPDIEEVQWFGGLEEPDFEDGARFYADGSVRVPAQDEIDANRKRMRRFYFVQNQAKRQNADPHEWRDRDGWRMVVQRRSRGLGVRDGAGRIVDYRDGFQAVITHTERGWRYVNRGGIVYREPKYRVTTQMHPYRGLAVAAGLELLTANRLLRRQRVAREARERMAGEHGQAGRAMAAAFGLRHRNHDVPVGFRR